MLAMTDGRKTRPNPSRRSERNFLTQAPRERPATGSEVRDASVRACAKSAGAFWLRADAAPPLNPPSAAEATPCAAAPGSDGGVPPCLWVGRGFTRECARVGRCEALKASGDRDEGVVAG